MDFKIYDPASPPGLALPRESKERERERERERKRDGFIFICLEKARGGKEVVTL